MKEKATATGSTVKDGVAGAVKAVKDKASNAKAITAKARDSLASMVLRGRFMTGRKQK
jgi:hypothetical protein